MVRTQSAMVALASLLLLALPGHAQFTYNPPGQLTAGSGSGSTTTTVHAPGMRFPIQDSPAYLNSQVWGHGGYQGPSGGQCHANNYSYPWFDNYCETRSWDMPLCPSGKGHQGQDMRPATCVDNSHWVVASEAGTITSIGSYTVYLQSTSGVRHRFLHMNPSSLQVSVGNFVTKGQLLGRVSNAFGGTPTTIHLHYDMRKNISGLGNVYVSPYMSLVTSYQELIGVDAEPEISIDVKSFSIDPNDPEDFRPEGSSAGIHDIYVGDDFITEVWVTNAPGASATADSVFVGVWIQSPYLEPLAYHIYTDAPANDQTSWIYADADGDPLNPPLTAPPASGKYRIGPLAPGETRKVRIHMAGAGYSIGEADHPDVRAWVWHVGDYYGEQTSWNDPVETNVAGVLLRDYEEHDVYSREHWAFNGPNTADTEGWRAGTGVAGVSVAVGQHALSFSTTGPNGRVVGPAALINTIDNKALELRVKSSLAASPTISFRSDSDNTWTAAKSKGFETTGGNVWQVVHVDMADVLTWAGNITQLRLDWSSSAADSVVVDYIKAIPVATIDPVNPTPNPNEADTDNDGVSVADGDCDDDNGDRFPGNPERCDGKDQDCDNAVDEGFDVGVTCTAGSGSCVTNGSKVCAPDALSTVCDAVAGVGQFEQCNNLDDDCDGEVDEDYPLGQTCTVGTGRCKGTGIFICAGDGSMACNAALGMPSAEECNGIDDDCDGAVDEDGACGNACFPGSQRPCALTASTAGCLTGFQVCDGVGWGECVEPVNCTDGNDPDTEGDTSGGDATSDTFMGDLSPGDGVAGNLTPGREVSFVSRTSGSSGCASSSEEALPIWLLLLTALLVYRKRAALVVAGVMLLATSALGIRGAGEDIRWKVESATKLVTSPVDWDAVEAHPHFDAGWLPRGVSEPLRNADIPVLAPNVEGLLEHGLVTTGQGWYAISIPTDNHTVVVTGTGLAFEAPDGPATYMGPLSTRMDMIVEVGFVRFGVAYSVEVECAMPNDDPRCTQDAYIEAVIRQLSVLR